MRNSIQPHNLDALKSAFHTIYISSSFFKHKYTNINIKCYIYKKKFRSPNPITRPRDTPLNEHVCQFIVGGPVDFIIRVLNYLVVSKFIYKSG
jgi:hypothetical protein